MFIRNDIKYKKPKGKKHKLDFMKIKNFHAYKEKNQDSEKTMHRMGENTLFLSFFPFFWGGGEKETAACSVLGTQAGAEGEKEKSKRTPHPAQSPQP